MKNAILRSVTVVSETDNRTMEVGIPYDCCDDGLSEISASEALRLGIDVPSGWIKPSGTSPMGTYYEARVSANGITFDAKSGKYFTPSLESVAEQRLAASLGMQPAIIVEEQVPEGLVPPEHLMPAIPVVAERRSPIVSRPKLLPMPKEVLPPAKIAVPQAPPPTIKVEAKNEVTPILQRFACEQQIYMLPDNDLYAFDRRLGYYRRLGKDEKEIMLMQYYEADVLSTQNPARMLKDAAYLLSRMPSLRVDPGEPNPYLWAFRNVIVNVLTGEIQPNNGQQFIRSALQCDFYPGAECPTFDQLIETISYGCADVKQLLWEVIAYILSPDTKAKRFFLFAGLKDSGKSLMANILTELLGKESCSSLNTSDLDKQFALGNLYGKRLNVCMDLADEVLSTKAVGFIKMLTGGDMIHADRKFQDAIEFQNTAKLLLGSNFTLRLKTPDDAVNERMVSIPFRYSVPRENQDHNLLERIRLEFPGIALKAMPVFLDLKRRNLAFTEIHSTVSVVECSPVTVVSEPALDTVIREGFEFTSNREDILTSGDAYDHYCQICGLFAVRPVDRNSFSVALRRLCLDKGKKRINGTSENCFFGVKKK